jgi:N6-adenosine-specific RNA methylase IME4
MKYDLIVSDPPWSFDDGLRMSTVKRSAEANYAVLDIKAIKQLKVSEIAAENAVLALWVPSSLLQEGLDTMKAWGFRQTQTHIWVKIKNEPLFSLIKLFVKKAKSQVNPETISPGSLRKILQESISGFSLDNILAFGMGRLFRQTHEICLLGVRGKAYENLSNKAQRSVHFDTNKKHSAKPEILQDRLEKMYPKATKLEMFARRSRADWTCVGLECPDTIGEDIRDSLDRLSKLP